MTERMVDIHLHGALADSFGPLHQFAVSTPHEAVRALSANYPEFRRSFLSAASHYYVLADGDWRDTEEAAFLPLSREVHFVPKAEGGIAGLLTAGLAGIGITGLAGQLLGGVLAAVLVWGITQLLFPPEEETPEDKSESYTFTGADNVAQQGAPVPIIYGRVFVGSVVASAGLQVADQVGWEPASSGGGKGGKGGGKGGGGGGGGKFFGAAHEMPSPEGYPTNGLPEPVGGWPQIAVMFLGPPEARIRRLGPVGWDYMGQVTLLGDMGPREVDVFAAPDRRLAWDYWQGFFPYRGGGYLSQ